MYRHASHFSTGFRYVGAFVLSIMIPAIICCSPGLKKVEMTIGGEKFSIEIAETPQQKERGLMGRKELAADRGMLFVYDNDMRMNFWMKNTAVPLSIAFLAADGTVREIYDMKPFSERNIISRYSCRYALEVPQGTFTRLAIEPGDRLEIPKLP